MAPLGPGGHLALAARPGAVQRSPIHYLDTHSAGHNLQLIPPVKPSAAGMLDVGYPVGQGELPKPGPRNAEDVRGPLTRDEIRPKIREFSWDPPVQLDRERFDLGPGQSTVLVSPAMTFESPCADVRSTVFGVQPRIRPASSSVTGSTGLGMAERYPTSRPPT
jgi:hypothetical protein